MSKEVFIEHKTWAVFDVQTVFSLACSAGDLSIWSSFLGFQHIWKVYIKIFPYKIIVYDMLVLYCNIVVTDLQTVYLHVGWW